MKILGLSLDKYGINLSVVKKSQRKLIFQKFSTFEDFETLDEYLSTIEKKSEFYLASTISTVDLLIRDIKIPIRDKKGISKALPFQLESVLPYSLNEASYSTEIIKEEKGVRVKAFVVSNKLLENHINQFKRNKPYFIGGEPLALCKSALYLTGEKTLLSICLKDNECL